MGAVRGTAVAMPSSPLPFKTLIPSTGECGHVFSCALCLRGCSTFLIPWWQSQAQSLLLLEALLVALPLPASEGNLQVTVFEGSYRNRW